MRSPNILGGKGGASKNQVSLAQIQWEAKLPGPQARYPHMAERHIPQLLCQTLAIGKERIRLIEAYNVRPLLAQHSAQALKPLFPHLLGFILFQPDQAMIAKAGPDIERKKLDMCQKIAS